MPSLLQVTGIDKAFGGVQALRNVSFEVASHTITALVGPNGAGKSTCFNIISGTLKADAGQVLFKGKPILGLPPAVIARSGIGRTFQTSRLFRGLTVLENVMVGCHRRTRAGFLADALNLPISRSEERWAREQALEALRFVGLESKSEYPASGLPLGDEKLLEIARALAMDPELLLLDEPAAGLNDAETEELANLLERLREAGRTVLIVEHNMRLISQVSNYIIILNFGEKLAEGVPEQVLADPQVIAAYLGGAAVHAQGA